MLFVDMGAIATTATLVRYSHVVCSLNDLVIGQDGGFGYGLSDVGRK